MERTPKPEFYDYNDEEVFQNYMEDLQLTPEDFDKTILDVGSGSGQFAKWAKEHQVSSQIFSLEPRQESLEKTKNVVGRAEALPFSDESFDLVVSDSAIPNIFFGESLKGQVRDSLLEMMRVIKPGGEIRLGRVIRSGEHPRQQKLISALNETLQELRQDFGAEIEEIHLPHADIYRYINHEPTDELVSKSYLIKIIKPIN